MQQNIFLRLQTKRLELRSFGLRDLYLVARILRNPKVVFWRKKTHSPSGAAHTY